MYLFLDHFNLGTIERYYTNIRDIFFNHSSNHRNNLIKFAFILVPILNFLLFTFILDKNQRFIIEIFLHILSNVQWNIIRLKNIWTTLNTSIIKFLRY